MECSDIKDSQLLMRLGVYTSKNFLKWIEKNDVSGMTIRDMVELYDLKQRNQGEIK